MNRKLLFGLLVLALGLAMVVMLNFLFGGHLPNNILTLNIIVSCLVFISFCCPLLVKWDKSEDKIGTWVGTLGLNIWAYTVYGVLAILAIILMNMTGAMEITGPVPFKYQFLVHAGLLLFLIFTRFGSSAIAEQVENVYKKEESLKAGREDMKSALRRLQDAVFVCDAAAPDVRQKIDALQEDLRFLSPANNREAQELEQEFVEKVNALIPAFINYKMNEDSIIKQVSVLKYTVDKRKAVRN